MDDKNLSDDMVKLVTYDIVSIAREAERILCSGSVMVTDNTSGEAFASWMIARHLQSGDGPSIPDSERKYLRVHYRVKERWPKQSLYYEERQLATLEGIQEAIRQATISAEPAPSRAAPKRTTKPKTGSGNS